MQLRYIIIQIKKQLIIMDFSCHLKINWLCVMDRGMS